MQLELKLNKIAKEAAAAKTELEAFLLYHHGWRTASEISARTHMTDRVIRAAANLSNEIISGPGSPGYCHARHCPPEDIHRIAAKLESQGRAMIARSIRIRKKAHRAIG